MKCPLSASASEICGKLEKYHKDANLKSVYSIASILDPRIKLQFFKNHVILYSWGPNFCITVSFSKISECPFLGQLLFYPN